MHGWQRCPKGESLNYNEMFCNLVLIIIPSQSGSEEESVETSYPSMTFYIKGNLLYIKVLLLEILSSLYISLNPVRNFLSTEI